MAYYYLHEAEKQQPRSESEFKYICYTQSSAKEMFELPFEKGSKYMAYSLGGRVERWSSLNDMLEVMSSQNIPRATFDKIFEKPGFTVWKNKRMQ
jgi:hypothetical protein